MLSNHFGDELLPIILPIVQQRLHDADWRARESGEGLAWVARLVWDAWVGWGCYCWLGEPDLLWELRVGGVCTTPSREQASGAAMARLHAAAHEG